MNKLFLLLSLLLPLSAISQNSVFPTDGGNAGIGTTTPGNRLSIMAQDSASNNMIQLQHTGIANSSMFIGTGSAFYPVTLQRKANVIESYTDLHLSAANAGKLFFETGRINATAPIRMTLDNAGRLGIGTTTPATALHVNGGAIRLTNPGGYPYGINIDVDYPEAWAREFSITHSSTGKLFAWGVYGTGSAITYAYIGGNTSADLAHAAPWMTFKPDGNIGIGTTTPQAKLAVNGDVFAKKVKVTQTGWPDYVFNKDYALPSLTDIEKYIKEHQHLPDIPAAAEIEKDGLDLGEMNKKLVQKMEEMTLYLIELKNENKELKQQQNELLKRMAQLEKH
jgi:hypothetical protein